MSKSIWHKLPEQPEKGRDVLEKWHYLGIHYTHFVAKNGIAEDAPFTDAWCYLDDLLALETELERTRKALDVAIERLEQIAHESFQCDQQSINMGFNIRAEAALTDIEQITALEQKNK